MLRAFAMQLCITLAGMFAVVQSSGQSGFNLVFNNPLSDFSGMRFADVVVSNDTLTVIGTYGDDSLQATGVIVLQIDTFGHVLRYATIIDSTGISTFVTDPKFQAFRSSSGAVMLPVFNFYLNRTFIAEFNSTLELLSLTGYSHEDIIMAAFQVLELGKGKIAFGWIQRNTSEVMPFALAVDKNGNELWRRYYGENNVPHEFGSAVKVSDNEYVLGCGVLGNSNGEEDGIWSQPWIFAIDSLGNILWEWKGEKQGGNSWIASNLRRTSDGGWVYTPSQRFLVEVFPTIFESRYAPMLVKRDSSMNFEWNLDYDPGLRDYETIITDAFIDDDNQVYLAGNAGVFYGATGALGGRVLKASILTEGLPLWEVIDTGLWSVRGSGNYLTGITVAKSGSVFACGRTRIVSEPQAWLIKITADGCIDTLCTTTSLTDLIEMDKHKFNIYPNPSQGRFTIEADKQSPGDYVFTLYDIYGRLVEQERFDYTTTISAPGGTPLGIYAYVIRDETTGRQLQSGKVVIE